LTGEEKGKEVMDVRVPHGVEVEGEVCNTGVAILRVWWEDDGTGQGKLDARGRLEGWGMADHLLREAEGEDEGGEESESWEDE
jgi:hypothetical protein